MLFSVGWCRGRLSNLTLSGLLFLLIDAWLVGWLRSVSFVGEDAAVVVVDCAWCGVFVVGAFVRSYVPLSERLCRGGVGVELERRSEVGCLR